MVRGFYLSDDLKAIFKEGPILWPLIIPFFVFFDKSLDHLLKIFNTLYLLAAFFLLLCIIYPTLLTTRLIAENMIPSFVVGSGFLLMNSKYLSNKKVNLSFFVLLISALSYTYLARRSAAFTLYAFIFIGYIFNKLNKSNKFIFRMFPILILAGGFFFLISNEYSNLLLKKIDERLYEDTRSDLFDQFYIKMRPYMVFGKGMNGTYYYPMEEMVQDDGVVYSDVTYRNNIENGYLQLLLTGGLLQIILFVLVLLPASLVGIFKSSNTLTRACGVMILLWLIDMFLYGLPTLSIHYVIIWICAGFCFKKSWRKKTDYEIYYGLNANYCKFISKN